MNIFNLFRRKAPINSTDVWTQEDIGVDEALNSIIVKSDNVPRTLILAEELGITPKVVIYDGLYARITFEDPATADAFLELLS